MECRRNIKLVIAYNGSAYHGWQRQIAGMDSVQERVERAASRVCRQPIIVSGASRTDAGVHALGQSANFFTSNLAIPLRGLRRAMNSALPRDIAIVSAREAPEGFQASRSAVGKTYRYRIWVAPLRPATIEDQVYHYWRSLDVEPMRQAAARVVGRHDFRGFATSLEERPDTVRTVHACQVSTGECEAQVIVQGDGFLYNMVRNIVGTLIEVGRGRWGAERIDKILASCDRADAGPTAPPQGLTLVCVHY
jgi:tRNA pseudouridine38-40 synthase